MKFGVLNILRNKKSLSERKLEKFVDKLILERMTKFLPYTTYDRKKNLFLSSKKLPNLEKDFIKLIHTTPKIWYNEEQEILTISEELSEKSIKELMYIAGARGIWSIRPALVILFSYSHYRKRMKEFLLGPSKLGIGKDVYISTFSENLAGKCVFWDNDSPRFWVKWKSLYTISDIKKADFF